MTEQKTVWIPVWAPYESESEILVEVGLATPSSLIDAHVFLPRSVCRHHHGQWWVPAAIIECAINMLLQRWSPVQAVELYWRQLPVRDGQVDRDSLLALAQEE